MNNQIQTKTDNDPGGRIKGELLRMLGKKQDDAHRSQCPGDCSIDYA